MAEQQVSSEQPLAVFDIDALLGQKSISHCISFFL
jgi:hypothetical protein